MADAPILINLITSRLRDINQSRGIREGWQANQNKALFSGSYYAYVAHETAVRMYKSHRSFDGREAFKERFQHFRSRPDRSKRPVIRRWGEALRSDPEIAQKIDTWMGVKSSAQPSPSAAGTPEPEEQVRSNAGGYALRPRRVPRSRSVPENNTPPAEPVSEESSQSSLSSPAPPSEVSELFSNDEQPCLKPTATRSRGDNGYMERTYKDFPMHAVRRILPARLFDSLQRIPHSRNANVTVAELQMYFYLNSRGDEQCIMAIGLARHAVLRYAMRLYGVTVEERDTWRHIYFPDTLACVRGSPDMQLFNCPRRAIDAEFGPEIGNAIRASAQYKQEKHDRQIRTDTVRMRIPHNIDAYCEISLQMESDAAISIVNQFYKAAEQGGSGDGEEPGEQEESGEGEE